MIYVWVMINQQMQLAKVNSDSAQTYTKFHTDLTDLSRKKLKILKVRMYELSHRKLSLVWGIAPLMQYTWFIKCIAQILGYVEKELDTYSIFVPNPIGSIPTPAPRDMNDLEVKLILLWKINVKIRC